MLSPGKLGEASYGKHRQLGFSLIELLVVVAIILIIAAIAIPNYLHAKMAANESSAISSVRSIVTAEVSYSATYGAGYGTLAQLGTPAIPCTATPAAACLLDALLSLGTKSGYQLTANPLGANNAGFEAAAVPQTVGLTGQRTFCVEESGVIRSDINGGPDPTTEAACDAFPAIPQ